MQPTGEMATSSPPIADKNPAALWCGLILATDWRLRWWRCNPAPLRRSRSPGAVRLDATVPFGFDGPSARWLSSLTPAPLSLSVSAGLSELGLLVNT